MCLGKHGNVAPLVRIVGERGDEGLHKWEVLLVQGFLQGEGHAGVVDVLTGETEVYEFLVGLHAR